jgi:hypothetical protein
MSAWLGFARIERTIRHRYAERETLCCQICCGRLASVLAGFGLPGDAAGNRGWKQCLSLTPKAATAMDL